MAMETHASHAGSASHEHHELPTSGRALDAVDDAGAGVEWFVLNSEAIVEVDITAADALEELRAELGDRGIRVNAVAPGAIRARAQAR